MIRRFAFFAVAVAALFFVAKPAFADFVTWTYNFGRSPVAVAADTGGTGGITLTDEQTHTADGTSDIVATNLRAFSDAPRNKPDRFTNKPYTLSLFLEDNASKQTTTLTFKGVFNGTISATSANVTTTFDPTTVSQTVVLGGHTFKVNLGNYVPPGPPDASNAGSISAHVAVDEVSPPVVGGGGGGGGPPPSQGAPEPSTIVLSLLGASGLGLASWRRLRQTFVRC